MPNKLKKIKKLENVHAVLRALAHFCNGKYCLIHDSCLDPFLTESLRSVFSKIGFPNSERPYHPAILPCQAPCAMP